MFSLVPIVLYSFLIQFIFSNFIFSQVVLQLPFFSLLLIIHVLTGTSLFSYTVTFSKFMLLQVVLQLLFFNLLLIIHVCTGACDMVSVLTRYSTLWPVLFNFYQGGLPLDPCRGRPDFPFKILACYLQKKRLIVYNIVLGLEYAEKCSR